LTDNVLELLVKPEIFNEGFDFSKSSLSMKEYISEEIQDDGYVVDLTKLMRDMPPIVDSEDTSSTNDNKENLQIDVLDDIPLELEVLSKVNLVTYFILIASGH